MLKVIRLEADPGGKDAACIRWLPDDDDFWPRRSDHMPSYVPLLRRLLGVACTRTLVDRSLTCLWKIFTDCLTMMLLKCEGLKICMVTTNSVEGTRTEDCSEKIWGKGLEGVWECSSIMGNGTNAGYTRSGGVIRSFKRFQWTGSL